MYGVALLTVLVVLHQLRGRSISMSVKQRTSRDMVSLCLLVVVIIVSISYSNIRRLKTMFMLDCGF